jgi:hypothetical protein
MDVLSALGNRLFAQSENAGALPTLYAAVAEIPGDSYIGPRILGQWGAPVLAGRSSAAKDADAARRLWDVSEDLTGVTFPLGTIRQ